MTAITHPLHNVIPYRLTEKDGLLKWLYLGDKRFTEPFFDETIARCMSFDRNSKYFTSASTTEWLKEVADHVESVPPTAFIFHVSRCGSTLLSQLLGLDEHHIVLSEVPLLDELLRLHGKVGLSSQQAEDALQASIKLMGQKRTGREKHLFIKLDSWHTIYWRTLRKLYPHVPFVLLYRAPVEVARSHNKNRGMQMVPGIIDPELFGFTSEEISNIPFDKYTARVLEKFYAGFTGISQQDNRSMLVNYKDGIMNIINCIATHSGITFSKEALDAMEERSRYHSKYPGQSFSEQQAEQPPPLWLLDAIGSYNNTEKQRKQQL